MTEDNFIEDPSFSTKAYHGWSAVGIPVGGARGDGPLFWINSSGMWDPGSSSG